MADVKIILDRGNVVAVEHLDRGFVVEGVKDVLNAKDIVDFVSRKNPVPVLGRLAGLTAAAQNIKESPVLTEEEKVEALKMIEQVGFQDDVQLVERPGALEQLRDQRRANDAEPRPPSADQVVTGVFDP